MSRLHATRAALGIALIASTACGDATGPKGRTLEVRSGNAQRGLVGWPLEAELTVEVTFEDGAPAADVPVRFSTQDGGSFSPNVASTTATGLARSRWTLGPSTVGMQRATASIDDGAAEVGFAATALGPDATDVVVVHGTLDALTGIVLVSHGTDRLDVSSMLATSDTVIAVPPADTPGRELVLFGRGNRPLRAAPPWTPGTDTVHLTMSAPVAVDIEFDVRVGPFATRRATMLSQLDAMEDIWREEGMGTTVGEVTFIDNTSPEREDNRSSTGICSGLAYGNAIRVTLVSSIDDGQFTGWGCWSGHVFLGLGTDRFPYLLAHELGHTFTLVHTPDGMMRPNPPGRAVREGETFRAHFHQSSALTRIFASQPDTQWMNCSLRFVCLPETLDLDLGIIALTEPKLPHPDLAHLTPVPAVDDVGQREGPGR